MPSLNSPIANSNFSLPPLRLGIAGLGTVGMGVISLLKDNNKLISTRCGRDIIITAVSARDVAKNRGLDLSSIRFEADPQALVKADDVDVILELIGGSEGTAKELVDSAIIAGKPVVTANKALLAHHGATLSKLAAMHNSSVAFEAAVAGGIPLIKTLREGLGANAYTRVEGILNGTCNYILTTMERTGSDFEQTLKVAQELGYAEADPSFDVDGMDTAHKLAIISALAFGTTPNMKNIYVEGIRDISLQDINFAKELGYRIKLLGITALNQTGIEQRVHPCMVPLTSPLATVDDAFNAVSIEGNYVGRVFLEGRGAGAKATASAVVADVMDIARLGSMPALFPANSALMHGAEVETQLPEVLFSSMDKVESGYYLRLGVLDRSGVLSKVAGAFAKANISVRSLIQHAHKPGEPVQIVLITHKTNEAAMREALETITGLEPVISKPKMIRIEE